MRRSEEALVNIFECCVENLRKLKVFAVYRRDRIVLFLLEFFMYAHLAIGGRTSNLESSCFWKDIVFLGKDRDAKHLRLS